MESLKFVLALLLMLLIPFDPISPMRAVSSLQQEQVFCCWLSSLSSSISSLLLPPSSVLFLAAAAPRRGKRKPKRQNVETLHDKAGIGKFHNMVLCRKEWEDMHDR